MDEGSPSVSIIIIFTTLLINILVHGFSVAITHVRQEDVEKKAQENKDKISAEILKLIENNAAFVKNMQFLNVVLNMILGGICIGGISRFFIRTLDISDFSLGRGLTYLITGLCIALLIMCFGIIIPRRLSFRQPEKWAYFCFYPVSFLATILYPFTFVADSIAKAVLYVFGVRGDDDPTDVTEEEIKSMVSEGQEQGVLQETEADMITNIFEFSDKEARDIMTNRKAMVAIDANMSLKDAVNFMMDTNNSRFPVFLDDIDHIIGIMHIRDAMKKLSEETDDNLPIRKIKGLLRQPKFVPETRNIDSLFHSMQSSKTQMVIIIDEYDEDENYIKPTRNPGEFTIEGNTPLEILEKRFKISFEESEFETLNGYIISKLDRIPEQDEDFSVVVDGYSFKILSVNNHMIQSVLLNKLPEPEVSEEEKELEIAK